MRVADDVEKDVMRVYKEDLVLRGAAKKEGGLAEEGDGRIRFLIDY